MIKDELGNRRFYGVYRAIVSDNVDPLKNGRLKLQIPQVFGDAVTGWAWGISPSQSSALLPNIGDGVFVSFEGGDPSYPIWHGTFAQQPSAPIIDATAYSPVWSGTGLTFTGTPATGRYNRIGKQVFFQIKVAFNTVTNFGTGQYQLTLPVVPEGDYIFRNGGLHLGSTHYNIAADAEAGTTTVSLFHMQSGNGSNSFVYDDPFTGSNPVSLTTNGYMYISGTYFTV
jgi:hypothetical protein